MYRFIVTFLTTIIYFYGFSQENIYLRDDFTSNRFKWNLLENKELTTKIEDGNLLIFNKTKESKSVRFVQDMFMYNDSDFYIETKIELQSSEKEQYGGLIWHSLDENNGFYFEVSNKGKARVWANKDGGVFNLLKWTEFPELVDKNAFVLKIDRKGNLMNLFVNDILVYPSKYRGQFAYQIGFIAGSEASLSVDYLLVKHPKVDISDKKIADKIKKNDLFWILNEDIRFKAKINGSVKNALTNEIVENLIVNIVDSEGKQINVENLNTNIGFFEFILTEKKQFFLKVRSKNYITQTVLLDMNVDENSVEITKEILLSPVELGKTIQLENVLFERSQAILLQSSYKELDKLAEFMLENPKIEIELSGHTDNSGNATLNLELSEKRVLKVMQYLIEKGIDESRIAGKGYGGSKPIANNDNEMTRKLNRRVEFKITKM